MPKRSAETYTADDGFVEDAPAEKKSKRSKPKSAATISPSTDPANPTAQKDDQGDSFFVLNANGTRRATLNKFKGKWMVNLREYYDADGVMKPGKKGISLPLEQYSTLIRSLPAMEALLTAEGETVPRPEYDAGADAAMKREDDAVKDEDDEGEEEGKKNYESTSEEE